MSQKYIVYGIDKGEEFSLPHEHASRDSAEGLADELSRGTTHTEYAVREVDAPYFIEQAPVVLDVTEDMWRRVPGEEHEFTSRAKAERWIQEQWDAEDPVCGVMFRVGEEEIPETSAT